MKGPADQNFPLEGHDDIFDFSPIPMWIYDLRSFKFLRVNQAAIRHYGYSEKEFLSMTIRDIRPAEDIPKLEAAVKNTIEREKAYGESDSRHKKKSGEIIYVRIKATRMKYKGNEVEIVLAIDLTEDKKKESEIIYQKQLFHTSALVSSILLTADDWQKAMHESFRTIGETLNVDRVYLFENHIHPLTGEVLTSQRIEWAKGDVSPQINNPELQDISIDEIGDFVKPLKQGKPFVAIVSELPDSLTKDLLIAQQIKSLLVLPLFIYDKFQGFVGIDDCTNERIWTELEIQFLVSLCADLSGVLERKEILQKLKLSEKRFRALVQEGADLTAVVDGDGNYKYVSSTSLPILGYPPEFFIGKNAFGFIHPEDSETIQDLLSQVLVEKQVSFPPYRFKDHKGEWRWLETKITNMMGDAAVKGIVANSRDITTLINKTEELERANERYRKANRKLKTAQQIARIGYWSRKFDSDLSEWSEETYRIYGYTPENFIPTLQNIRATFHPDDVHLIDRDPAENLEAGEEYSFAHRIIRATGEVRWVNARINLVQDERGRPYLIEGTVQDITDQKRIEEELRVSKERFELAMKATNEMIWDWDHKSGKIIRSYGYEKLFGYRAQEEVSKSSSWHSKIHEEDAGEAWSYISSVLNDKNVNQWKQEYRLIKQNGEVAFVVDRGFIIRDESGRPLRSVGATLDVTESRKQFERIKLQNERLREIAWLQSHVIRAPLARIMGLIYLIEEDNLGENSMKDVLSWIMEAAHELDGVIKNITDKTERTKEE